MKTVRFNGRRHHGTRDSLDTPPLVGSWHPGETRRFDAAFARRHNRHCGGGACERDVCQGDCFAYQFAGAWNVNAEHNAKWFTVLDVDGNPEGDVEGYSHGSPDGAPLQGDAEGNPLEGGPPPEGDPSAPSPETNQPPPPAPEADAKNPTTRRPRAAKE